MIDRALHDRLFADYDAYARSFAGADGKLQEMQELKFAHSHRVAEFAREIAARENWPEADILLAGVVGLYHDIARYRQYRDYRTFQDYRSFNHGEAGAEILRETRLLRDLGAEDEEAAVTATRHHNAKVVPGGLSPRQELFLWLDRDSDKLDIYDVLYDNVKTGRYLAHPEVFHGVDPDGPVTPAILAGVRARQPLGYEGVKSVSDFLMITVLWVYELHYPASRRLARERRVVDHVGEIVKMSPEVADALDDARAFLRDA